MLSKQAEEKQPHNSHSVFKHHACTFFHKRNHLHSITIDDEDGDKMSRLKELCMLAGLTAPLTAGASIALFITGLMLTGITGLIYASIKTPGWINKRELMTKKEHEHTLKQIQNFNHHQIDQVVTSILNSKHDPRSSSTMGLVNALNSCNTTLIDYAIRIDKQRECILFIMTKSKYAGKPIQHYIKNTVEKMLIEERISAFLENDKMNLHEIKKSYKQFFAKKSYLFTTFSNEEKKETLEKLALSGSSFYKK